MTRLSSNLLIVKYYSETFLADRTLGFDLTNVLIKVREEFRGEELGSRSKSAVTSTSRQ